jgi:hypothetical protein
VNVVGVKTRRHRHEPATTMALSKRDVTWWESLSE